MKTRAVLATLVVLVVAAVAPATVAGAATGGPGPGTTTTASATSASSVAVVADDGDLDRTVTLWLTPEDPGTIRAVVEYDTPSNLASLVVQPGSGTVTATTGFSKTEEGLKWDEETATPSFTLSMEVNETIAGSKARRENLHATSLASGYAFVDVGAWAIVPTPQFSSRWTWYGSGTVTLSSQTRVAGEGAVGGTMAYLGPHATYTASGTDQTFSLVVPRAAELAEPHSQILNALTAASRMMQVGARDERVFMVAAPTSVNWGPAGLEYGGSDAWVLADSRLDVAGNVWLHEYVHTRQSYDTTDATKWTTEATAEYYAALLTLQQDRIGFDAFARHLRRGTVEPYASAVLADPSTWTSANYIKGPLVYGNIDRAIRVASGNEYTAEDVLGLMNRDTDGALTQTEFLAAISRVSNDDVASYARKYTTTSAVPDMWSRTTHARVFGSDVPRLVSTISDTGIQVTGQYRNRTYGSVPTLVPGETLTVTISVRNEGGETGTFSTALLRNGSAITGTSVRVQPGERTTVNLTHTFESPGTYTLAVGYDTRTIRVRPPAAPNGSVSVNQTTVARGGAVGITLTASNLADYPARETFAVTVDGEQVTTWTVTLAPNETSEFRTAVVLEEPGSHTITVGERSFTVTVEETPGTGTDGTGGTGVSTPGFGVVAGLLGAVLAHLFAHRTGR